MLINRCVEKENEVQIHIGFYSTINRNEIITFAGKLVQLESSGTRRADETSELERDDHLSSKTWGRSKRNK